MRPIRLSAAARGFTVVAAALALASLLNAEGLRKTAEIQPQGFRRHLAIALTRPLVRVSHALYLDRPRRELKAAVGRSGDDRISTEVSIPPPATVRRSEAPPAKHPPTPSPKRRQAAESRPAFSPRHPLRVWVAGDSLAAVPGQALERAVGSSGAVQVLGVESRVATGLGRPDIYNWFERFPQVIRELRPRVVVFSFGGDDGHNFMSGVPTGHEIGALGSPTWNAEYLRRLDGVTREFAAVGIYVVWLGLPIIRGPTQDGSFRKVNELLRAAAAAHPRDATYIDAYAMFENRRGRYTDYLRGARGELVLMRASDGIHYQSSAGDLIARTVLQRLNAVFDLTSWQRLRAPAHR